MSIPTTDADLVKTELPPYKGKEEGASEVKFASRLAVLLAATASLTVAGTVSANAQDGPLPPISILSPLLCINRQDAQVKGDNNQVNQIAACNQTATTTTPPSNAGGLTGFERAVAASGVMESGATVTITAQCPPGKTATGGGYRQSGGVNIHDSFPTEDGTGWTVQGVATRDNESFSAWAACYNAAS
ncbi:hypothetical protein GCM10010260_73330 [Streptomyces filipinensis]|uniref:Uncharacterized protein n=1 Tax=Streptomyces filipinensis TaxID=66887 RepID=A0A918IID9_9ACTN|nr:hypothetical protein [Streptomyces filipinensis]GGV22369.1 hypothetical protein GCM10010260_73330 [Streptomyces filipinensis]